MKYNLNKYASTLMHLKMIKDTHMVHLDSYMIHLDLYMPQSLHTLLYSVIYLSQYHIQIYIRIITTSHHIHIFLAISTTSNHQTFLHTCIHMPYIYLLDIHIIIHIISITISIVYISQYIYILFYYRPLNPHFII